MKLKHDHDEMIKLKVTGLCLSILLIVCLLAPLTARASDVDDADFYGVIVTSNNSTSATAISSNISGLNTSYLISAGFINSSANNCAIRSSSGADMLFMPGNGTNPWIFYLNSINSNTVLNSTLFCKNVTDGDIVYFPNSTGMSVTDSTTLEPGANFTMSINGYLDTTVTNSGNTTSTNSVIFNHSNIPNGGIDCALVNSGQVMLSAGMVDRFFYDGWTDVSNKITVDNVTNKRLDYLSEYSATDTRCYADLTALSNTYWSENFTMRNTAKAGATPAFSFGMYSTPANHYGFAGDSLGLRIYSSPAMLAGIFFSDAGAFTYSAYISLSDNTTYYYNLTRNSATQATLSIYSDVKRTTHITGSPITLAIPATVTTLRYIQGTNDNSGAGAGNYLQGWIDDVFVNATQVKLTGITTGETVLTAGLSAGTLSLTVGTASGTNVLAGSIGNSPGTWNTMINNYLYMRGMSFYQGGIVRGHWAWQYGSTFTDLSGNGNTAYPSFRTTSSNTNVSSVLSSFMPVAEPTAPAFAVGAGPNFLSENISATETPNSVNGSGTLNFPLKGIIDAVAAAGGVPYQIPSTFIGSFALIALSIATSFFLKDTGSSSIFVKSCVNIAGYGVLVALKIFDWWMLIFFFIFEQSIWFAAKERRE